MILTAYLMKLKYIGICTDIVIIEQGFVWCILTIFCKTCPLPYCCRMY